MAPELAPGDLPLTQGFEADLAALGLQSFFALVPPIYPPAVPIAGETFDPNEAIVALNARLQQAFPSPGPIDFYSGMQPADYRPDGLHLADAGQRKRMQAAWPVLFGAP